MANKGVVLIEPRHKNEHPISPSDEGLLRPPGLETI